MIDGVDRPYMDLFRWIALAGAAYLPATVVPAGMSADGLPIGVQIVGPYLHDRTTLQLARHLAALTTVPHPALACVRTRPAAVGQAGGVDSASALRFASAEVSCFAAGFHANSRRKPKPRLACRPWR